MAIRPLPLSAAVTSALAFLFQLVASADYMTFFDVISYSFTMLVPAALICVALFKDGRWMPAALAATFVGSGSVAWRLFDYVTGVNSGAEGYGLRVVIMLLTLSALILVVIEAAQLGYLKLENHPVRKADGSVPVMVNPALAQQAAQQAAQQPAPAAPAAPAVFQAGAAQAQGAFQPDAAQQAAPSPFSVGAEQAGAQGVPAPAEQSVAEPAVAAEQMAQQAASAHDAAAPAAQAAAAAPVAGWYADPANAAQLRYWDGTAWTGQTQPRA
ncbi:DUF2510 domain-containing protein [Buchananella felis]|uniref:DUF2510 domain-containing protein n=1 Tax=Buchananella felis TaxID=3231492 RepID=UPI003528C22D